MQCRAAQAVNPHATTSVAEQRSKAVSHAPGALQELLNAANGSVSLLAVVSCVSSSTAMLMQMKIRQSGELVNNPNRNSKRDQQSHWKRTQSQNKDSSCSNNHSNNNNHLETTINTKHQQRKATHFCTHQHSQRSGADAGVPKLQDIVGCCECCRGAAGSRAQHVGKQHRNDHANEPR